VLKPVCNLPSLLFSFLAVVGSRKEKKQLGKKGEKKKRSGPAGPFPTDPSFVIFLDGTAHILAVPRPAPGDGTAEEGYLPSLKLNPELANLTLAAFPIPLSATASFPSFSSSPTSSTLKNQERELPRSLSFSVLRSGVVHPC
jgi:hypothetical protein